MSGRIQAYTLGKVTGNIQYMDDVGVEPEHYESTLIAIMRECLRCWETCHEGARGLPRHAGPDTIRLILATMEDDT